MASRPNVTREIELFPGVSSLSKEVIEAKVALAEQFRARQAPVRVQGGFKLVDQPGHSYPADTAGLRTVSAQMDPELCIRAYNRDFVSVPDLTPLYAELGVEVFLALFGVPRSCGFTFRRDTSSGPYTFVREPDPRIALFTTAVQSAPLLADLCWAIFRNKPLAAKTAATSLAARDLTSVARIIRRYQVDSARWTTHDGMHIPEPGKVREGEDWLGTPAVARKLIELFGRLMLLARSRGAWSMAAGLNLLLNLLISIMRLGMLTRRNRLFMPLDDYAVVSYITSTGAVAASFDAKNCDQHHPAWVPILFGAMMEVCGYGAAAGWLEFLLSFGPVVQTNDHVGGRGMSAFGLPCDPFTHLIQGGNKSGISTNELKNKWLNMMDQIARGIAIGHLPRSAADALVAEMELWREDMDPRHACYEWSGGDNILVVGAKRKVEDYRRRLLMPRGSRFVFDYSEDPFVDFDGHEFVKIGNKVELWPSIKRAVDKLFSREYSWSRKTAPATGALEVIARVRRVLGGDEIAEQLLDQVTKLISQDAASWLATTAAREQKEIGVHKFSLDDLEVMEEPSKLTWKEAIASRVSRDVVQRYLHSFDEAQAQAYRNVLTGAKFPSFLEFMLQSMNPANRRLMEVAITKGLNRHDQTLSSERLREYFAAAERREHEAGATLYVVQRGQTGSESPRESARGQEARRGRVRRGGAARKSGKRASQSQSN
jgi:hypothetical protein